MKKSLIGLVVFLLLASMVFIGIGCKAPAGTQTTAAAETTAGVTAAEASTTTAATTEEPKKEVKLVFWHQISVGSPMEEWFNEQLAGYQKLNPNVTIIAEPQPGQEMTIMVQTALAAHRGPDIMENWAGVYTAPFNEALVDIKQYVSEGDLARFGEWINWCYYDYDPTGKLFGLPNPQVGFFHYIYNKTMFKDAGITFEPTAANNYSMTWDEFIDACNKLKAAGQVPIGWGNDGGYQSDWSIAPLWMQSLKDKDDWIKLYRDEMKWNDPAIVEGISRVNDLYTAGYYNEGGLSLGWGEGLNLVKNKKVAMQMMFWGLDEKGVYDELGSDFGMMLVPVFAEGNPYSHGLPASLIANYVIPTWSEFPQEATDLVLYLMRKESMDLYAAKTGGLPPTTDFDSSLIKDEPAKKAWDWLQTLPRQPQLEAVVLPSEVFYEMCAQSMDMYNGKLTPQQVGDKMQERCDQLTYGWLTGNISHVTK